MKLPRASRAKELKFHCHFKVMGKIKPVYPDKENLHTDLNCAHAMHAKLAMVWKIISKRQRITNIVSFCHITSGKRKNRKNILICLLTCRILRHTFLFDDIPFDNLNCLLFMVYKSITITCCRETNIMRQ